MAVSQTPRYRKISITLSPPQWSAAFSPAPPGLSGFPSPRRYPYSEAALLGYVGLIFLSQNDAPLPEIQDHLLAGELVHRPFSGIPPSRPVGGGAEALWISFSAYHIFYLINPSNSQSELHILRPASCTHSLQPQLGPSKKKGLSFWLYQFYPLES